MLYVQPAFSAVLMTAALKCLVLLLKTVGLLLTFGCSFCEIRLGCREVQLCQPGSQEHGKTVVVARVFEVLYGI